MDNARQNDIECALGLEKRIKTLHKKVGDRKIAFQIRDTITKQMSNKQTIGSKTLYIAVAMLIKVNHYSEAARLYTETCNRDPNMRPDMKTSELVMSQAAHLRDTAVCSFVYTHLSKHKKFPITPTERGRLLPAYLTLYARLRSETSAFKLFDRVTKHDGVVPDEATMNALLSACFSRKKFQLCLSMMTKGKMVPGDQTHDILIKKYHNLYGKEKALAHYRSIASPTVRHSTSAAIVLQTHGDLEGCLNILKSVILSGQEPSGFMMTAIFEALLKRVKQSCEEDHAKLISVTDQAVGLAGKYGVISSHVALPVFEIYHHVKDTKRAHVLWNLLVNLDGGIRPRIMTVFARVDSVAAEAVKELRRSTGSSPNDHTHKLGNMRNNPNFGEQL